MHLCYKNGALPSVKVMECFSWVPPLFLDLFCFKVQIRASQVPEAFKRPIQTAKRSKTLHLRDASWDIEVMKRFYIVIAKAI